jgi:hypothetical protein
MPSASGGIVAKKEKAMSILLNFLALLGVVALCEVVYLSSKAKV